jgi:hypothetical protein
MKDKFNAKKDIFISALKSGCFSRAYMADRNRWRRADVFSYPKSAECADTFLDRT